MHYFKEKHMICLEREECEALYKDAKVKELLNATHDAGYTLFDLAQDKTKMEEIANEVSSRISTNKEEIEIFASVFCYLQFYPEGSRVCFVLEDSLNPSDLKVSSLDDLIGITKEYSITDFGIFSDDGLRQFQLKQFKGDLDTETLFSYIDGKLKKYGYDLGDANLLVVLQSSNDDMNNLSFKDLSEQLSQLELKSESHILISYNEDNKTNVINTVYPSLGTTRVPIKWSWQT